MEHVSAVRIAIAYIEPGECRTEIFAETFKHSDVKVPSCQKTRKLYGYTLFGAIVSK